MALIDDLLRLQVPRSIRISPGNQQVLYFTTPPAGIRHGESDTGILWLGKTGHPGSSRQLTPDDRCCAQPEWHPGGQSIVFASTPMGGSQAPTVIYSMRLESNDIPEAITPETNKQEIAKLAFSPDGKFVAYLSADEHLAEKGQQAQHESDVLVYGQDWSYHRLRLVEISTKKVTTLVSLDRHITEFAFNNVGNKIAFFDTKGPRDELAAQYGTQVSIVDIFTQYIEDLATLSREVNSLTWASDHLYALSRAEPSSIVGGMAVFSLDTSKKGADWELCAHGTEDCPRELGKADRDMTVKVQHRLQDQIRMLNGSTIFSRSQEIKAWDAAFSTDSDEVIIAVAISDVNTPYEVYTTTASGGALVKLSNHGDSVLKGKRFGVPEFLKCPSADGEVELDAVWIIPVSQAQNEDTATPTQPLPTVVVIRGGPYARDTNKFDDHSMWIPCLLGAGYAVLQPNYRGGSSRGNAFAAAIKGAVGVKDYDDVITLIQHAVQLGYADPERLVVGGWSQGGYLTYLSAVRNGRHGHGWKYKGAIAGAGVCDLDTMSLTSDPGIGSLTQRPVWMSAKDDISNRKASALWEFKGAADAGDVIPPMLLLHGERDTRIPVSQAVGFRRALDSAGLPYEMVVYPREGHQIREAKHVKDMTERVVRFVRKCVGEP